MRQNMEFFRDGEPRQITLDDIKLKLNTEGEVRIRLDFVMPLNNKSIEGAPKEVDKAYRQVSVMANACDKQHITSEYDDIGIELFMTPDNTSPMITLSKCKIQELWVFRPTPDKGSTGDTFVKWHVNLPDSQEVWDWCHGYFGKVMWAAFHDDDTGSPEQTTGQGVLPGAGDEKQKGKGKKAKTE